MQSLTQLRKMQEVMKVQMALINGNEAAMQSTVSTLMDFAGDLSQANSTMDVVNVASKHEYILTRVYVTVDLDEMGELMISVKNCDGEYIVGDSADLHRVCEALRDTIDQLRG